MLDSIIKLVIGDLKEKRAYRQLMKRVDALPKEYRFAFRKIQNYMYTVGPPNGDMSIFMDLAMFTELVDLFEASATEGKHVLDVIGSDADQFSDELMRASSTASGTGTLRENLNKEVLEKLGREGR